MSGYESIDPNTFPPLISPTGNWNWRGVEQEPGGTGRYRHVMEYDDPLMPGTFPGHWLGPDGEPSVGDQSNLPGANPAFLGNGRLFLQSLLAGKNNNTGVTLGDTLASNPLDNPYDPQYEKMKSIMDAQGPIDPLERVYEPHDPGLDRDLLLDYPQVSVPYADPWLVADANVPINVNQGSDQRGGGATIANPTTLENSGGPPEYQRRFRESMTGGDPTRGGY